VTSLHSGHGGVDEGGTKDATAMIIDSFPAAVIQYRDPSMLKPHPDASLIPQMGPDEYDDLVEDIEKRGIIDPLVVTEEGHVIDGRERLLAAMANGLQTVPVRAFRGDESEQRDFMLRAAVLRRHLTTGQRKALAAKLIVAEPAKSDRSIAKTTGISRPTVAMLRDDLEARDQVAESVTSTGADGKTYPRPVVVTEGSDTPEAETSTDYDDLFAHAEDPKKRYRLGERVNGHYPAGRLKAIAKQYGTTVGKLKEHVAYWEKTSSCYRLLELQAGHAARLFDLDHWVTDGDGTVAELIPAIPARERKQLRTTLRKGIKRIEKMIEALS